jgi:translation initiation factor IF-2
MASDLINAMLGNNASPMAADPIMASIMPQLTLAQTMAQQGLSGAPAYPMQAVGRLAQALVGGKMMNDASESISSAYGRAAESMSKIFPEGTPIGDMLRSPDPSVRMTGFQMAGKAALVNSEKTPLRPDQNLVLPSTKGGPGITVGQGSPALAGQAAGQQAAAKAPYETGGEATRSGGPSGIEKFPISAATRAAMQPGAGIPPMAPSGPALPPASVPTVVKPSGVRPAPGIFSSSPPAAPPAAPPSPAGGPGAPVPGSSFNDMWGDRVSAPTGVGGPRRPDIGGVPVETPAYKANMATYEEGGKAIGGNIKEYIEAGGKNAQDRMNALDSIESAMRTNNGKGLVTGPQAEHILKFREMLDGMGIHTDWIKEGMPQSEMVQKMNGQLASASVKAISPRPTQFEFSTFQGLNPGLKNSPQGTFALLDVLRQTTRQDMDISRIAQDQANWKNMPQKVSEYYANHPLINPFTRKSMRDEIAAARGTGGVHAPAVEGGPTSHEGGATAGPTGTTSTGVQWSIR